MNMDLERPNQTQPQKPHEPEEEPLENGTWETPTHDSQDAESAQAEKAVVREREGEEEGEKDAGTETVREDEVYATETETKDFQKKELELEGGGAEENSAVGKKLEDSQAEPESVQPEVSNTSVASASELSGDVTLNETQRREDESKKTPTSERESPSQHKEFTGGEVEKGDKKATGGEVEKGDEKATGGEMGKGDEKESEWLDILGTGDLLKKVLRAGEGVAFRPTPQSRVRLRTQGVLEGGKKVDKHSNVVFTLGDGDVIQAWDLAVSLMERGEVACVKTGPRFAYGKLGRSQDIPPDASITYELELLEVMEPVDFKTVSEEEVVALADRKRVRGNELFQRKDYSTALNSYRKGVQLIEIFLEEQRVEPSPTARDIQIRCLNNLAAAQMKMSLFKEALETCEKVLGFDSNSVKALFRSGKIHSIRGELDIALKLLHKAATLNPEEKAIQVELGKAQKKQEDTRRQERAMYRRMMEGGRGEGEGEGKRGTERSKEKGGKPQSAASDPWGPWPYMAVAAVIAAVGIGLAYFLTQRHG